MFNRYHGKHAVVRAIGALPRRARIGILGGTFAGLSAVGLMLAITASASTTPGSFWTAQYWNSAGTALGGPQPVGLSSASASVDFTSHYLATLMTSQKADTGNQLNRKVSVTVDNETTGVTFQGEVAGGSGCSGLTNVAARVFFIGAGGGSGYYTQSWWSNPVSVDLAHIGTVTISVPILVDSTDYPSTGGWTDWNGKTALANQEAFAQAASHITSIGLSFGGGCFFENGVSGSGTFTLSNFSLGG